MKLEVAYKGVAMRRLKQHPVQLPAEGLLGGAGCKDKVWLHCDSRARRNKREVWSHARAQQREGDAIHWGEKR